MAMDQKDVSEFLKAITAELKKTQHKSAYEQPERKTAQSRHAESHTGDVAAMSEFAKIKWDKANKGLKAFAGMEKNILAAIKPFGSAKVAKGTESLNAVSKGLHTLSVMDWAEVKYGIEQLKDFATPMSEMLASVGKLRVKDVKTMADVIGIISSPMDGLVATLSAFVKVAGADAIQNAKDMAEFFKQFAFAVEEAATMPGGKEFKDNMDLIAAPLLSLSEALVIFAGIPFGVATAGATGMAEFFKQFAFAVEEAATMPGGKEFKDNMDLIAAPLLSLGTALIEFAKIDFVAALDNVILMKPFFAKFASGVEQIAVLSGEKFKENVALLSEPLGELGSAINTFGRIPFINGMVNALLMPAFFKLFSFGVNTVANMKNASKFGKVAGAIALPLQQLGDAITTFAEIGFIRAKINAWLMPTFFRTFGKSILSIPDNRAFSHKVNKLASPLSLLSNAISDFTHINFFKGIANALLMKLFVKAFQWGVSGIDKLSKVIEAVKPTIKSMGEVAGLIGDVIGQGFGALGKQLKNIALGALAIGLISASLAVGALSFSLFAGIDWAGVLIGIAALGAVAVGAVALGNPATIGFVLAGAGAIAALGVALIPAAYAMKIAGEAMTLMVDAATTLIPNLLGLAIAGPGLIATALALGVLSTSMLAFSAATTAGGWLSKLGGNSIVDQVIELGKQADPLNAVANALDRIVTSSKQLGTIGLPDQMGGVGRGQTMLSAQNQMATAQTETAAQPIVVSTQGGSSSQKSSVVNNTTNVSNSIMPDRMAGMMPSAAYSF